TSPAPATSSASPGSPSSTHPTNSIHRCISVPRSIARAAPSILPASTVPAIDEPSSMAGTVDAGRMLGAARAMERGTLMHRWMELVGWVEDGEPGEAELVAGAGD